MTLVDSETQFALERLVIEIAWRIDHGRAGTIWELFTSDGSLETGGDPLVGHDALRAWGIARDGSGRISRHICSSMRFERLGQETARGTTLLTVFMSAEGVPGSTSPAVVGEDEDHFLYTDAGWRFRRRTFTPVFTAM